MSSRMLAFFVFFLLVWSLGWSAPNSEKVISRQVDILGTGGAGIASYDRAGMFFMNPASFAVPETGRVYLFKLGAEANMGLYDYYNIYNAYNKNGQDVSKFTEDQWKKILNMNANLGITGPLSLGFVYDGVGMLLYDDFLTSMVTKQSSGLPYVDYGSYADIGFLAGFGFKLPLPVSLGKFTRAYGGVTVKLINRFKYENHRMSILEVLDLANGLLNYQNGFLMGQAIGSDAGLMIKTEEFSAGLVVRDWFKTRFTWREYNAKFEPVNNPEGIPDTYFYPACDVGVSYRIKNLLSKFLVSDLTFYLDLVNIFDFTQNFFLKTRVGAELTTLGFLKLRAGLYKGYPTLGLGVFVGPVNVNFTYYTEELGELPGVLPQDNYMLELQVMF